MDCLALYERNFPRRGEAVAATAAAAATATAPTTPAETTMATTTAGGEKDDAILARF